MIKIKIEPRGEIRAEVLRPDGTVRSDTGWTPNLVTNVGLAQLRRISPMQAFDSSIHVGTGTTPPAPTDTALEVYSYGVNGSWTPTDVMDRPNNRVTSTYPARQFPASGSDRNLTEFGLVTEGVLWCRGLFRDGSGNPTVVQVQTGDVLRVTYRIHWYFNTSETTTTRVVDGVSRSVLIRPMALDVPGPTTWLGNAVARNSTSFSLLTYPTPPVASGLRPNEANLIAALTYSVDVTSLPYGVRYNTSAGPGVSTGTIASIAGYFHYIAFQIGFDPPLEKTASKALNLSIDVSWERGPI